MADSNIHDDVRDIRNLVTSIAQGQARTEQKVDGLREELFRAETGAIPDLKDRLFTEGTGAIPLLWLKYNEVKVAAAAAGNAAAAVDHKLTNQRTYVAAWVAGVLTVVGVLKYWLAKIGLHI